MTATQKSARELNLFHSDSIVIDATPEQVWNVVTDIKRTGEWSPICKDCWWKEPATGPEEGAWFHGRNEAGGQEWETQSLVTAAKKAEEFTWMVGGSAVRWSYTLAPSGNGTELTEHWEVQDDGVAFFEKTFGDQALAQLEARREAALAGIPATLAAIKQIVESENS